jgi:hypothetical protein
MPVGLLQDCEAPGLIHYNEYAALRLEIRVSNPKMLEQTALHCSTHALKPIQSPTYWYWLSFPGVKQLNIEADPSIAFEGEDEIYGSWICIEPTVC